jgi:DNA-binding transcriptional regulator YhcF (GntR family)
MKRRKRDAQHVRIYHYMSKTPAWKSLNGNERATYLLLSERYMGLNNGKIPYSVREIATDLGISTHTASRCLTRLQERGFIVAMTKGAFSWKKRHATEWRLTEQVCNVSGRGPSSEYRNWRPEIQNAVAVAKPIGSCGETTVAKKTRDGSCDETVEGQKSDLQLHYSYTLSCQVPPSAKSAPSYPRARSTPHWAGYTSLPVELRLLALGLASDARVRERG